MEIHITIECDYDDVRDIIFELYGLMRERQGRIAYIEVKD